MSRDALVVGINTYDRLSSLKSPSEDAEAIAQLLTECGDFRVRRLPAVKKDGSTRVGQKTKVTLTQLKEALVQLFKPEGDHIPETALLFFSGHGIRDNLGIQEGYLATSDVNPDLGLYGLSLQWLRRLLQESPIRQQIIWLDCCYSGELLNFKENLKEADPGNIEKRDRCFIAASREYEVAYEETAGHHGILTGALLQTLDPRRRSNGLVTNFTLTEFIEQALKLSTQRPLFANSGNKIILTGRQIDSARPVLEGVCPYKGLAYFDYNDEDPKYFYGRAALTDDLVEKVRQGNFLAVLGASGSGKSSVVRAGLLHQLKLGQRLSSSNQWPIYIFRPREHPLQSLAEAFLESGLSGIDRADQLRKTQNLINSGAIGLGQLITASQASRVVLVVDQFEECFTLCRDSTERQQFFECLLGAVERPDNKLCLVLTMRADFLGKCLEQDYAGLAKKIQDNLVAVTPMNREELEQAITEPAKQVGLEVEGELVTQMITDVEGSPGSLPLLQYTLTELWKKRAVNWLTLSAYNQLGGVRGTLQKRADEVYGSLSPEEQEAAKRIFLELTQLGEGTEDTRRQVSKRELVTSQQSQALVDQVVQRLSAERLVVTTELVEKGSASGRVEVVDVAHEALIRYWPRLRKWIEDDRIALKQKRDIEEAALDWRNKWSENRTAANDYLLQGKRLKEVEKFQKEQADRFPLSTLASEFIRASIHRRWRRYAIVGLAFLVVAIPVVGTSPWLATYFNDRGQEKYEAAHQIPDAISDYDVALQDAISYYTVALTIKPGYPEALYNRGRAYEDLKDFDRARADYETAITEHFASAYSQLARLSVTEYQNYPKAAQLSEEGLQFAKYNDEKYALYKNWGWALLEIRQYDKAQKPLQEAIILNNQRGSAYCLLAQVLERQSSQLKAQQEWVKCRKFSDSRIPEEKKWIDTANQRLQE